MDDELGLGFADLIMQPHLVVDFHQSTSAEIPPKPRELATLSWYPIDAYMSMYAHEIISSQ